MLKKRFLYYPAGVLAIVVLIAAVGTLILQSENVRLRVERLVQEETGWVLSLDGGVRVRLFPTPGVTFTKVRAISPQTTGEGQGLTADSVNEQGKMPVSDSGQMSDSEFRQDLGQKDMAQSYMDQVDLENGDSEYDGSGQGPDQKLLPIENDTQVLLSCDELSVGLALMPLLSGEIALEDVRLHRADVQVRLGADADEPGTGINKLGQDTARAVSADKQWLETALPELGTVLVSSANVVVADDRGNPVVSVKNISLDYERTRSGQETVRAECTLPFPGVRGLDVDVKLSGELGASGRTLKEIVLREGTLEASLDLKTEDGKQLHGDFVANVEGDMAGGSVFAHEGVFKLGGLEVRGDGAVLSLHDSPRFRASLDARVPDVERVCVLLNLPVPRLARVPDPVAASVSGHCVADADGLGCGDVQVVFGENHIQAEARMMGYDNPAYQVTIGSDYVDFTDFLPAETLDEEYGRGIELSLDFTPATRHPLVEFLDLEVGLKVDVKRFRFGKVDGSSLNVDLATMNGLVTKGTAGADFVRGGFVAELSSTNDDGTLDLTGKMVLRGRREGVGTEHEMKPVLTQTFTLKGRVEKYSGSINVQPFNMRDVVWTLGAPMPDWAARKAFRKVFGELAFSGDTKRVTIDRGQMVADGSKLTFKGALAEGAKPDISCRFEIDDVDVAKFVAPDEGGSDDLKGHPFAHWDALLAPHLSWTHNVLMDVDLNVKNVRLNLETLEKLRILGRVADGDIRFSSIAMQGFGGDLNGAVEIKLDGPEVLLDGNITAKAVRPGRKYIKGAEERLPQSADCTMKFSGKGKSPEEIFRSLSGEFQAFSPAIILQNWDEVIVHAREARMTARFGPVKNIISDGYAQHFEGQLATRRASFFGVESRELGLDFGGNIHWEKDLEPAFVLDGKASVAGTIGGNGGTRAELGLRTGVIVNLKQLAYRLEEAELTLGKSRLATSLDLELRGGAWELGGTVTARAVDLADACEVLGLSLYDRRDPQALRNVKGNTRLKAAMGRLEVTSVRVNVDGNDVQGRGSIDFTERPEVDFYVSGRKVNVDGYLPAKEEKTAVKDSQPSGSPVPAALLRSFDCTGIANVEQLTLLGVQATNVRATLNGKGGQWHSRSLGGIYGGRWSADVDANSVGTLLSGHLDVSAENVALGSLLDDALGKPVGLAGAYGLAGKVSYRGNSWNKVVSSLRGDGSARWSNAAFGASLPKEATGKKSSGGSGTNIGSGSFTYTVDKGVLDSSNIYSDSRALTVTGKGRVDLPGQTVDVSLNAATLGVASVPISIKGPFSNVRVQVSGVGAVLNTATEIVKVPLKPFEFLGRLLFGGGSKSTPAE